MHRINRADTNAWHKTSKIWSDNSAVNRFVGKSDRLLFEKTVFWGRKNKYLSELCWTFMSRKGDGIKYLHCERNKNTEYCSITIKRKHALQTELECLTKTIVQGQARAILKTPKLHRTLSYFDSTEYNQRNIEKINSCLIYWKSNYVQSNAKNFLHECNHRMIYHSNRMDVLSFEH